MSYWVVRYDVLSMAKDATYHDLKVEAPSFVQNYNSLDDAGVKAKELNESAGGEVVELDLKNNKHYKGKRYVYSIAEDNRRAEEIPDAAEQPAALRRTDDGVRKECQDENSTESRP